MTTLIIDVQNVASRYFYALPVQFRGGDPSRGRCETIKGFLREIIKLAEDFQPDRFVFCFDSDTSLREKILPYYKGTRKANRQGLAGTGKDRVHLHKQVNLLRKHVLPELGFTNLFRADGYEADDLIASAALHLVALKEECVLVSSDKDLYQLLGEGVVIYNHAKNKTIDEKSFREDYGIFPWQWVNMKAIAGCSSDDIPGVEGVGDVSALKYVKGELGENSRMGQKIKLGKKVIDRNLPLVRLPFEGCPYLDIVPEGMTFDRWPRVLEKVGISLEIPCVQ